MKYRSLLCVFLMIVGLSVILVADAELLSLPEDVKRIESESFMGINADRVYFPSGIEYIADDAFSGVSFIGEGAPDTYAQEWCISHGYTYQAYSTPIEEFEWSSVSGGISITKYIGNSENVYIPSVIDSDDVVSIGNNAFKDATKLKSVSFPNTLETIGQYAFYGCTSLNRIILSDSVETIDKFAFMNCTSLESIVFSSNLDSINESAFQGCTSLKSVDLPDSLTYLGWRAFRECSSLSHFGYPVNIQEVGGVFLYGCTSLKEVTVPEGVYKLMDFFIANAGNVETVNLPSTLEIIGKYAFAYDNAFTSITLPESVEIINDHAFYQCYNLKSIQFSNHLDRIEESAFQECTGLTSVDFPESLTYLGWRSFRDCSSLTHFGYPTGIQEVGGVYLYGCDSLKEVTVPEGVTRLMDFFISGNTSITTVNLPSTLKEIGRRSFARSTDGDQAAWKTIILPEGLERIGEEAFSGCTNLTNIDIPASVIYIGLRAFDGASGLKTITFHEGLTSIDTYAFRGCSALKTVTLPNTVATLGCAVFENCTSLTTFNSSTGWNEVFVPGSMSTLAAQLGGPRGMFAGCTKLTTVTIPEGAECIPRYAFSYAPNLTTVNLPSTIKTIGEGAFMEAKNLRTINFPEGLTVIGFGAFKNCSSLKAAELPDSVTTIGCYAFYNCTNLSSIHYPLHWTTVSSPSFYGDTWALVLFACGNDYNIFGNDYKILSVDIPDGVNGIPPCAFQNCTGLKAVTIPDSVTQIMSKAFENCSSLPQVYISPNVTDLGDNIFSGCKVLTVWCEYGSTILQYCKDNSVKFYYLTPDGVNSPSGTLYQGDSYGLHGYARASIPLTNVTATIWNSDKSEIIQTISVNPNVTDYDLSGTVNYNMQFSTLPLGNYHYTLTASTEKSEEIWADTTFKIVEQPLRISFSGFVDPGSILDTALGVWQLSGVIRANYIITSITAIIMDENGNVASQITKTPNAKQCSITDMSLNIQGLQGNDYTLYIRATAKGETRTVLTYVFGTESNTASLGYSDELRAEVVEYVRNVKAGIFLPGDEVNHFLSNMSFWDKLWMALSDYNGIAASQVKDWFTDSEYSTYMEKKYEAEIANMICDMFERTGFEEIELSNSATKAIKEMNKIFKGVSEYGLQEVKDKLDEIIKNYDVIDKETLAEIKGWKMLKDQFERISDLYDKIEVTELFLNMCMDMMRDYSRDLQVLEVIADTYSGTGDSEFTVAIDWLRSEYLSQYGKALNTAFQYLEKELTKIVTKKITGELLSLAMTAVNRYFGTAISGASAAALYSIVDTACQITIKLSGTEELGSNRINAITQIGVVNGLQRSFSNACYDILLSSTNGNSPSDSQIYKLQTLFRCARQELIRLYSTMKETDTIHANSYKQLITETEAMIMPGVLPIS